MARFTAQELIGKWVSISLKDGVTWNGKLFLAETGEAIDNARGLDIHIDLKEQRRAIIATIKLVDGDYMHPTLVDMPIHDLETIAMIDEVED